MEAVSIVVPTHGRPQTLGETLDALLALDYPHSALEIIVVDDGATAATKHVVQARANGAVAVSYVGQRNSGAGAARNAGARHAEGSLLCFCDDDIVVAPGHLHLHLKTRDRYGDALVNGVRWYSPAVLAALEATPFGRYLIELERGFDAARDTHRLDDGSYETDALYSCDLVLRRDLFWELGGFDERFPYAGAEDQDLALRARAAGCRLIRDHAIHTLHNDPVVTLGDFCAREERGCEGVVLLARKHPAVARSEMIRENTAIRRGDGPVVVGKKVVKAFLSRPPVLRFLHGVVGALERLPLSDSARRRMYSSVIGLHIYRGIQAGA